MKAEIEQLKAGVGISEGSKSKLSKGILIIIKVMARSLLPS